jgi:hypothetical protein
MAQIWQSVMPKIREKNPSKSHKTNRVKETTTKKPSATSKIDHHDRKRSAWSTDTLKVEIFEKFCQVIQASLNIFVQMEAKIKCSQPSESEPSQNLKNTSLTQDLLAMEMNAGEPPEEIFERHQRFEFEPVLTTDEIDASKGKEPLAECCSQPEILILDNEVYYEEPR